ncbi:MAG: diguanylate cyclase [Desulfobacterales bacterium]
MTTAVNQNIDPGEHCKKLFPILLAEDQEISRRLTEKYLCKAGLDVTSVENGLKAFELFKKQFFPIVLSDWMMPEMDGLELCRAIRSTQSLGYVFIILLTARDSKEDIIAGLEAGADDYLAKPFNPEELNARIKTGMRILTLERSLKKATEELKKLSVTDPLTGCYNKGYLNERLPKDIKYALRYRHPLSLILCDIDHFKNVNDTFGHQAGDVVLKRFTDCIKQSCRFKLDWLARYGGEEFILILPETDVEGAGTLGERLRNNISRLKIIFDNQEISITASFGITGFDHQKTIKKISSEALISKADQLLYQAKQEGRNRTKVASL